MFNARVHNIHTIQIMELHTSSAQIKQKKSREFKLDFIQFAMVGVGMF